MKKSVIKHFNQFIIEVIMPIIKHDKLKASLLTEKIETLKKLDNNLLTIKDLQYLYDRLEKQIIINEQGIKLAREGIKQIKEQFSDRLEDALIASPAGLVPVDIFEKDLDKAEAEKNEAKIIVDKLHAQLVLTKIEDMLYF